MTCYPLEIGAKVELQERFSASYQHPEKQSKYARPILELELVGALGSCVRCYLTLPARPREGKADKDITQNEKGDVIFKHVKLMNFGDPLRALTWVEDYIKNDEHGQIPVNAPIIRSFLITVAEYARTLADNEVLLVDADRTPGQVRFQAGDDCPLHAVKHSLTSFMEGKVKAGDGCVKSIDTLSEYLFGEPLAPHRIAAVGKIAHQHGRMIEGKAERYQAIDKTTQAGQLLAARQLERDLAGFNLEPTSGISANAGFLLFGEPKKKQGGRPKKASVGRGKENKENKENQPNKKNR